MVCPQVRYNRTSIALLGLTPESPELLYLESLLIHGQFKFSFFINGANFTATEIHAAEQKVRSHFIPQFGTIEKFWEFITADFNAIIGASEDIGKNNEEFYRSISNQTKLVTHSGVCYRFDFKIPPLDLLGGPSALTFGIKGSSNPELTALWQIKEAQYVHDNYDVLFFGKQYTGAALPRIGKHLQYDPDPAVIYGYYLKLSVRVTHLQNLRRRPCLDYYSADERYDCMARCVNEELCVANGASCVVFVPGETDNATRVCSSFGLYNTAMHCSTSAGLNQPVDPTPYNVVNELASKCAAGCMRQCTTAQYDVKSMMKGPSENRLSSPDTAHTFVAIIIESGESNLVMEEQMVYTPAGFLASLGGTISLYCGASVLSIMQLLWISLAMSTKKLVPIDFHHH